MEEEKEAIPGLKLICHNANDIDNEDDPSYPYKLEMDFSPPKFLAMLFNILHGGRERVVVRAMTKEALDRLIEENKFRTHPRLRSLVITGPDNFEEKVERGGC